MDQVDKRKCNTGRPCKLSDDTKARIGRKIPELQEVPGPFSSKDVQLQTETLAVSNRTVRRVMNKLGYHYLDLRKKGLLSKADVEKRLEWARRCRRELPANFWKAGISMYFDGMLLTSHVYYLI